MLVDTLLQVLLLLNLDSPWVVVKAPLLLQAGFAAVTDLYVYNLSRLQFGEHVARQEQSHFASDSSPSAACYVSNGHT